MVHASAGEKEAEGDASQSSGSERPWTFVASPLRWKLAAAFGSAVLILVVGLAGTTGLLMQQRSVRSVERSESVLADLDRLLIHIDDTETGQRGYLITGDSAYLAPYFAGLQL